MKLHYVLGLDLGGTKIAAGVVDSRGRLHSDVRIPTPATGVKKDLAALIDAALAAASAARVPWARIMAIGVGVPGAVNPATQTVWAPNLPGWKKTPLQDLLEATLERPAFVEGDRNVQALAEAWLGAGKGVKNLVFLTVGTGIGAGLISEGRLIPGAGGVSGAAGWMPIRSDWREDFGRIGCLEALGAGPAVVRIARSAVKDHPRSLIAKLAAQSPGEITSEIVAAAARRGDQTASRVLEEVGRTLGLGVAGIVSLLNPEVVVVGGGLAELGERLLAPLRQAVRRWGQPLAVRRLRIVRSRLGTAAGMLGAARYAFMKMEE
jgi:glucokinase